MLQKMLCCFPWMTSGSNSVLTHPTPGDANLNHLASFYKISSIVPCAKQSCWLGILVLAVCLFGQNPLTAKQAEVPWSSSSIHRIYTGFVDTGDVWQRLNTWLVEENVPHTQSCSRTWKAHMTGDHVFCMPGDKAATGPIGTPGGQCTLVQRIGPNLVISGKDVTINTTLNPEIKVSQAVLGRQFLAALKPQRSKEKPKQNSDTLHGTFALLWRAVLPKRNDFSGFPYIVPNGVPRKVNLVPHRLMCYKVRLSRNPENVCAP
uniref:Uncharacterized protein LOC109550222 n=1 Tax=Tursiops truncatus TaxID=9739 RepID=A0A2U4BG14_TURTR|nr:uncharacterized protein LOC109550222 [Tursiops truncatus]